MSKQCGVADRLREFSCLWHAWRANILEESGELPDGFEDCVLAEIGRAVEDTRGKLQDALNACNEVAAITKLGATKQS